jgi:Putative Mg2+ and Co2+ transporter CorC
MEPQDREALIELLRDAQRRDLLDADALAMIEGVLQVSEMQARDIMIPRAQMAVVARDDPPEKLISTIVESGHSRLPVIGNNRDEVIGLLLAKDLLRALTESKTAGFNLREVLRPVLFIPESKRLDALLKEFRASRNHMVIVVDEYGGVAGLVTIEDVLEQIVGEIEDEHDIDEGNFILKHANDRFIVKALTPIADFNEYFGTNYSDAECDTIGGLVMREFEHLPARGETITIGPIHFKVVRADNRRVHRLRVTRLPIGGPTRRPADG